MTGKEAIMEMFAAFGNSDNKRMAVYIKQLSQFPAQLIVKACHKAMLEHKFLPTLADLVGAIKSLVGEAKPETRTKEWAEAWEEIDRLMRRYGCTGKTFECSTQEIEETIKAIGGIDVLATCPADNFNTLRAQVRRMYEDTCKRKAEKQINKYVLGEKSQMLESKTKMIGKTL